MSQKTIALKKQEFASDIFKELRQRILEWKYLPGQRLTEEAISNEFGISRIPVREALSMLIENGLVTKEAYKGYYVNDIDLQQIREIYEVRLALELYSVSVAAQRIEPADYLALHEIWGQLPEPIPDDANWLTLNDEQFHLVIARQTGNDQFVQLLAQIFERLRIIRIYDFSSRERILQTYQQHQRILDCIREHQVQQAQQAITENIRSTEDKVERSVAHALSQAYLNSLRR